MSSTTAKRITVTVQPPPPPAVAVPFIELRSPVDVAETLAMICSRISGSPSGRRGHMDQISLALLAVGINWCGLSRQDMSGEGIGFTKTITQQENGK